MMRFVASMVKSFFGWFEKKEELSWKTIVCYVLVALFLSLAHVFVLLYPFQYFFSDLRHFADFLSKTSPVFIVGPLLVYFLIALFEEVAYRLLPLGLAHHAFRGIKRSSIVILLFGLISSALYASFHTYLLGREAYVVFLPIGMIWSVLATKIFYSMNRYKYLLALGALTITHFLYDTISYPFIYALIPK